MDGFGDYYGQTSLHPLALAVLGVLIVAVFASSRRSALIPFLVAATALPMAQRVIIAGADFTLLRLLLLAYVIRILSRREWTDFTWGRLDTVIVLWVLSGCLLMVINHGTSDALINRLGWAYDILLGYFASRVLIREWEDLICLAKGVCVISVPVALVFVVEWSTRYNFFSIFGGVPSETWIRDGRLRCQGPFAHPIIAGVFWAALLPLVWTLFACDGKMARKLAYVGTASSVVIVMATASSTPILALIVVFVGGSLFLVRKKRRLLWLGLIFVAFLLHFVLMNNPIWHLMARVDFVGGSTGWHRYIIFDAFVENFDKWFLLGERDLASWGVWQLRDLTNHYFAQGVQGGALTLFLFCLVLIFSFANVGRKLTMLEQSKVWDKHAVWTTWMVGVIVAVHAVTFLGLSYFGQLSGLLHLQLGIAGALGVAGRLHPKDNE